MTPEEWMTLSEEQIFLLWVRMLKNVGYGRMQQIISHEWYRHDPNGAMLTNTAYGLLNEDERPAYDAIAKNDPLFRED